MRLMEVQSYIADLGKAYVQHVNNITEGRDATIELPAGPSGFMGHDVPFRAGSPGAKSEAGGPKKRKRAPVDPNAPKRALTPYFLYMQHNRSKIAEDLGGDARPKDVADEGTRRWQSMEDTQKEVRIGSDQSSPSLIMFARRMANRIRIGLEEDVCRQLRPVQARHGRLQGRRQGR
jgi:hypothetical protein